MFNEERRKKSGNVIARPKFSKISYPRLKFLSLLIALSLPITISLLLCLLVQDLYNGQI
ncbi:hypothetical protein Hanom_Chr07g00614811 [Helianthus anomalus]